MSAEPRETPSPSDYRAKNPFNPPPREYKPPSLLADYKWLALLFAAVLVGFGVFGWYVVRHAPVRRAAPGAASATSAAQPASQAEPDGAAQPVYIQSIPDKSSH